MASKTAWVHFEAQRQLAPMLRQMHDSITISHHVWDRAVKSACERRAHQRHLAYDLFLRGQSDCEGDAELRILQSWFTCVGCCAHDLHNSFRWSILSWADDRQLMKSCWVCLASLRSSVGQLVAALPCWLAANIDFEDHSNEAGLLAFWRMLGLEGDWLALLVRLQIRRERSKLMVSSTYRDDRKIPQVITSCLLYLWRVRQRSSSRWCGMGQTARGLVGCLFLGLQSLIDHIMADPGSCKYYIQGFSVWTPGSTNYLLS